MGNLRDREVACLASDRQGSNFEPCVWRAVNPQEVLLAKFSLCKHKGWLKPHEFYFLGRLSWYQLSKFVYEIIVA